MAKELDAIIRISGELDKSLRSAIKSVASQMDTLEDAAKNANTATGKLSDTIKKQKKALQDAQSEYANYALEGKESSQEAQELASRIQKLSSSLNKNKAALNEAAKAAQKVAREYDDLGEGSSDAGSGIEDLGSSAQKAKGGLGMMKTAIAGIASAGVLGALVSGAKDAATAIFDLAESTREFRQDTATLTTAYNNVGFSAETANNTARELYSVFGEDDRAIEAANNIARMSKSQQDLSDWITITTGVWGTYQDALPVEGLAESAGETAKVGTVTGTLSDALNWSSKAAEMFAGYMGGDVVTAEDAFNKALSECSNEQERQALITDTLMQLYGGAAGTYQDAAGSFIEANKATWDNQQAQAQLGATIEPVTTAWTNLKTTLAQALAPALETIAGALEKVIGWMQEHPAVVQAVVVALGILAAIITVVTIAVTIYTAVQMALNFALLPVIGIILAIVAAIAVVIAVVIAVKTHWEQIKQVAINVWNTILNVITTVVTAVWNVIVTIWSAIVSVVTTIWNAIVTAVSTAVNAVVSVVTSVWNGLVGIVSGIWNGILSVLHGIWNAITSAATAFANWVVSGISAVWNGLTNILTAPFRALSGIIDSVKSKVSGFIDKVKGIGSSIAGAIGLPGFAKGGFTDGISIAGEAGTEAVISFDPRYRADNLKYWAQAGRMLGADASDFVLSGGGGTTVNTVAIDNISFAPNITFNGDTDRESVVDAIREEYPEFLDMLEEWFAERGVTTYA